MNEYKEEAKIDIKKGKKPDEDQGTCIYSVMKK
jgi:hypothetical protein